MSDNVIVLKSSLNTKIGLYKSDYTAIPMVLKSFHLEYFKMKLLEFIDNRLPYDYKFCFLDAHNNVCVISLSDRNELYFGVLLDDAHQHMNEIAKITIPEANKLLEKL